MWIILGTLVACLTLLLGIATFLVRYALVPYLEHRWSEPFAAVLNKLTDVSADLKIFSRAFDGHLTWSQDEVDRIWGEFQRMREQLQFEEWKKRKP